MDNSVSVQEALTYMYSAYRIALLFRGSKFSRKAVLKELVEKNSRMCVAHARDSAGAQI